MVCDVEHGPVNEIDILCSLDEELVEIWSQRVALANDLRKDVS